MSIWSEEIAAGLVEQVPKLIKVEDESGRLVSVPCFPRRPEGEFIPETFPAIVFGEYDMRLDKVRLDGILRVLGARDEVSKAVEIFEPEIPVALYYQFDFFAKWQTDMALMLKQWCARFLRPTFLTLFDSDLGVARDVGFTHLGDMAVLDSDEDEDRYFRRTLSYKVDAYIASNDAKLVKYVQRRIFNVHDGLDVESVK